MNLRAAALQRIEKPLHSKLFFSCQGFCLPGLNRFAVTPTEDPLPPPCSGVTFAGTYFLTNTGFLPFGSDDGFNAVLGTTPTLLPFAIQSPPLIFPFFRLTVPF